MEPSLPDGNSGAVEIDSVAENRPVVNKEMTLAVLITR
jgi:hypothetical protein